MSRPKGSLNKSTIQAMNAEKAKRNGVYITKFEKAVEGAAITKDSSMGFVRYGKNNNYPQLMLDLYQNSPTHHAAINFEVQSVIGGGLDYEQMGLDKTQVFPNYQESWESLLRNITLDYFLYGSYSVQILKNKDNTTYSFYHIPYEKVRCSPYDEDGQITSYWISSDWSELGLNPPFQIDAIDMRDEDVIKGGKPYIYVMKNYDPTMSYYQSPFYAAGISAIQSEIQFIQHDLKSATNNFIPAGMLVLNEVETDQERQAIINNINNMFVGTSNSNSLLISFRNNVEETKPEFVPFQANTGNVNIYADANQRTINRILSSHNIPSASLCGLPDVGNSGFASDSQKLETAYQLYQKVSGNYHRERIVKSLNDMFRLNKIDVEIILKPLVFNDFGDVNDVSTDTKAPEEAQDVSTDNIEEKKDGNNVKKN